MKCEKNCAARQSNFRLAIDKEYAAGAFTGSVVSYFRVAKPLLELLQRDDLAVAFFLFFSGFLAPGIKLLISDAAGLDPREALFVLLAVRLENRVVGEDLFQIDRHDTRKPAVAVDDRRRPTQFLDRFEYAPGEEDGPFVVVFEIVFVGIPENGFAGEIVVVVDEIDLHSG